MILDNDLLFSNAQAVTAAAASTNLVDTAPLFAGNLGRNIGVGEPMFVFIGVDVAMTDAGSDSTLTVDVQTDDSAGFGSPVVVATLIILPALSALGTKFFVRLPVAHAVPYERFIRLNYTPNNGNLSTGSFTTGLIKDMDAFVSYAGGYTTGV